MKVDSLRTRDLSSERLETQGKDGSYPSLCQSLRLTPAVDLDPGGRHRLGIVYGFARNSRRQPNWAKDGLYIRSEPGASQRRLNSGTYARWSGDRGAARPNGPSLSFGWNSLNQRRLRSTERWNLLGGIPLSFLHLGQSRLCGD